jgi:YebC/PmpR family DNA-binding regulatory protein
MYASAFGITSARGKGEIECRGPDRSVYLRGRTVVTVQCPSDRERRLKLSTLAHHIEPARRPRERTGKGNRMSGHSKWSSIKHKKAAKDAKRGKIFTKMIKEITVAARMGGGDVNANPRLRTAVTTARAASMPSDNIERAIKKGTGELEGVSYEEINYEGYGPAGVAIMVSILTDNRNRTVAEIRNVFEKHGGNLGAAGCVAWMFSKKGLITVEHSAAPEERVFEVALEAGADDITDGGEVFEVTVAPERLEDVKAALEAAGIPVASAEVAMVPQNTVTLRGREAEQTLKLLETLEDHDDVQKVAANVDIPQEEVERLSA